MRYYLHQEQGGPQHSAVQLYLRPVLVIIVLLALAAVGVYILLHGMVMLGIATLALLAGTGLLLGASWWDVHHAYLEISSTEVRVVEYPFFLRMEKRIPAERIAACEVSVSTVDFSQASYLTIRDQAMKPLFSIRQSDEVEKVFSWIIEINQAR